MVPHQIGADLLKILSNGEKLAKSLHGIYAFTISLKKHIFDPFKQIEFGVFLMKLVILGIKKIIIYSA